MITAEKRQEIIENFRLNEKDTGSAHVQIALITERINHINGHMQSNKKDFASGLGLLKLVGQRNRLLRYLLKIDAKAYAEVTTALGLRQKKLTTARSEAKKSKLTTKKKKKKKKKKRKRKK